MPARACLAKMLQAAQASGGSDRLAAVVSAGRLRAVALLAATLDLLLAPHQGE